jgi:hypothetical protein
MPMPITRRQHSKKVSVLERLNRAIGTDCHLAPFCIIARRVAPLGPGSRRALLALCDEAITSPRLRAQNAVRVAAAKLLVALLPDSFNRVQSLLAQKRPRSVFEVHFSLFCFLDEVSASSRPVSIKASVLELVRSYLNTTRSDAAQAAWMAGDLLGDHWNLRESLSVLLESAEGAEHAAGRNAAIHGLEQAFERCQREHDRRRIRNALERASASDSRREVRLAAQMALDKLHYTAKETAL